MSACCCAWPMTASGGADLAGGSGLRGLQRRLAPFDGVLTVTSPVGSGTVVTAELPCAS